MLKIFNSLSKKKEEFKPVNDNKVNFYLCGPTVYDGAHIGHGRSSTAFDLIRRYLIYKGYKVNFVSNYTDIDDKMINRANERGITVSDLAKEIIPIYESDYGKLRILKPDTQPRATDYIKEIIELIKKLEAAGATYTIDDGVYFDISKFPEYGKLSKQKLEDLENGIRVDINENKKNLQDFVLWKNEKPGEPSWDSPWGKGRPGWHIECSAMSNTLLGETIDIHGGGADLMFPHHECEIAQSETANMKPFVKYWLHNGFITINKEKMSKSLGNFITLSTALRKYPGDVLRYLYMQTHYRSPINFTDDLIEHAKQGLERIQDFVRNIMREKPNGEIHKEVNDFIEKSREKFEKGMDNDFDTSEALSGVYDLIKNINIFDKSNKLNTSDQKAIIDYLIKIDTVFAILIPEKEEELDKGMIDLINEREQARKDKNWKRADEIRNELLEKNIELEDTSSGTIWKKKV